MITKYQREFISYSITKDVAGNAIIVGITEDQQAYLIQQQKDQNWHFMGQLPNDLKNPVNYTASELILDPMGDLQVFLLGTDDYIYRVTQEKKDASWTYQKALPNQNKYKEMSAIIGADGNLQLIALGTDGFMYIMWQDKYKDWHYSGQLPNQKKTPIKFSAIDTGMGTDGHLQIAGIGAKDNDAYFLYQTKPGPWLWTGNLPVANNKLKFTQIAMEKNPEGTLQLIGLNKTDGLLYGTWQDKTGSWTSYTKLPTASTPIKLQSFCMVYQHINIEDNYERLRVIAYPKDGKGLYSFYNSRTEQDSNYTWFYQGKITFGRGTNSNQMFSKGVRFPDSQQLGINDSKGQPLIIGTPNILQTFPVSFSDVWSTKGNLLSSYNPNGIFPVPRRLGPLNDHGVNLLTGELHQEIKLTLAAGNQISYPIKLLYNSGAALEPCPKENFIGGYGWKLLDYPKIITCDNGLDYFLDGQAAYPLKGIGQTRIIDGPNRLWKFTISSSICLITTDTGIQYTLSASKDLTPGSTIYSLSEMKDLNFGDCLKFKYNGFKLMEISHADLNLAPTPQAVVLEKWEFKYDSTSTYLYAIEHSKLKDFKKNTFELINSIEIIRGKRSRQTPDLPPHLVINQINQYSHTDRTIGDLYLTNSTLFTYGTILGQYPFALENIINGSGGVKKYEYYRGKKINHKGIVADHFHPVICIKKDPTPNDNQSSCNALYYDFKNWEYDKYHSFPQFNLVQEYPGGIHDLQDYGKVSDPFGHISHYFFNGSSKNQLLKWDGKINLDVESPLLAGISYLQENFQTPKKGDYVPGDDPLHMESKLKRSASKAQSYSIQKYKSSNYVQLEATTESSHDAVHSQKFTYGTPFNILIQTETNEFSLGILSPTMSMVTQTKYAFEAQAKFLALNLLDRLQYQVKFSKVKTKNILIDAKAYFWKQQNTKTKGTWYQSHQAIPKAKLTKFDRSIVLPIKYKATSLPNWQVRTSIEAVNAKGKVLTRIGPDHWGIKRRFDENSGTKELVQFKIPPNNAKINSVSYVDFLNSKVDKAWTCKDGKSSKQGYGGTSYSISYPSFKCNKIQANASPQDSTYIIAVVLSVCPALSVTLGFKNYSTWIEKEEHFFPIGTETGKLVVLRFVATITNNVLVIPTIEIDGIHQSNILRAWVMPLNAHFKASIYDPIYPWRLIEQISNRHQKTELYYDFLGQGIGSKDQTTQEANLAQSYNSQIGNYEWNNITGIKKQKSTFDPDYPNIQQLVKSNKNSHWIRFNQSEEWIDSSSSKPSKIGPMGYNDANKSYKKIFTDFGKEKIYAIYIEPWLKQTDALLMLSFNSVYTANTSKTAKIAIKYSGDGKISLTIFPQSGHMKDLESVQLKNFNPISSYTIVVENAKTISIFRNGRQIIRHTLKDYTLQPTLTLWIMQRAYLTNFAYLSDPTIKTQTLDGMNNNRQNLLKLPNGKTVVSESLYEPTRDLPAARVLPTIMEDDNGMCPTVHKKFAEFDAQNMKIKSGGVIKGWEGTDYKDQCFEHSVQYHKDPAATPASKGSGGSYTAGSAGDIDYQSDSIAANSVFPKFSTAEQVLHTKEIDGSGKTQEAFTNSLGLPIGNRQTGKISKYQLLEARQYDAQLNLQKSYSPKAMIGMFQTIYWTRGKKIMKSSFDTKETICLYNCSSPPMDFIVDRVHRKIYWTDENKDDVHACDIYGNAKQIIDSSQKNSFDLLALDADKQRLFVTSNWHEQMKIKYIDLTNSFKATLIISGINVTVLKRLKYHKPTNALYVSDFLGIYRISLNSIPTGSFKQFKLKANKIISINSSPVEIALDASSNTLYQGSWIESKKTWALRIWNLDTASEIDTFYINNTNIYKNIIRLQYDNDSNTIYWSDEVNVFSRLLKKGSKSIKLDFGSTKLSYPKNSWLSNMQLFLPPKKQSSAQEYSYNVKKQIIKEFNPDAGKSQYEYNDQDQLIKITDANAKAGKYAQFAKFDALGRKASLGIVDASNIQKVKKKFIYDGQLPKPIKNQYFNFNHFQTNKLTGINTPNNQLRYFHDAQGNIIQVELWNADGTHRRYKVDYSYDEQNRILTIKSTDGYDVCYTYDEAGRMIAIGKTGAPAYYASYEYGNGTVTEYIFQGRYDNKIVNAANQQIVSIENKFFGERLYFQTRKNGKAGFSDGKIASAAYNFYTGYGPKAYSYEYDYDSFGRLILANYNDDPKSPNSIKLGNGKSANGYDENGNILQITRNKKINNCHYKANNNQLLQFDTAQFSYDPNGNIIAATNSPYKSISYDSFSGLTKEIISKEGDKTSLEYDGQDRRVKKVFGSNYINYIHGLNPLNPIMEHTRLEHGLVETLHYINGPMGLVCVVREQQNYPKEEYAVFRDHQNSPRVVAEKSDESKVQYLNYMPFGLPIIGNDQGYVPPRHHLNMPGPIKRVVPFHLRYRFTGQEYDAECGLYNFHQRMYDPRLGRFLSIDPLGQYPSPYIFAGDHPLLYVDPTGTWAWGKIASIGFGAVMVVGAIGLTVMSGGAAVPFIAAAAVGGGTSSISYGVTHSNEEINLKDWLIDTSIGTAVGATTGGAGKLAQLGIAKVGAKGLAKKGMTLLAGGSIHAGSAAETVGLHNLVYVTGLHDESQKQSLTAKDLGFAFATGMASPAIGMTSKHFARTRLAKFYSSPKNDPFPRHTRIKYKDYKLGVKAQNATGRQQALLGNSVDYSKIEYRGYDTFSRTIPTLLNPGVWSSQKFYWRKLEHLSNDEIKDRKIIDGH